MAFSISRSVSGPLPFFRCSSRSSVIGVGAFGSLTGGMSSDGELELVEAASASRTYAFRFRTPLSRLPRTLSRSGRLYTPDLSSVRKFWCEM